MKALVFTAAFVVLILARPSALAQSSSRFAIARSAVAGGGTALSSSARFQLAGTIAQPLAAVPASARFSIQGGFWIWPAPIIFAPAKVGNNFVVSIQTELGQSYTVQYSDSLNPPNWQNLPSITGNGGVETVTNSAPVVAQRYYRLIEK